ncbi:MAG: preprotein translocase subunit YajC [Saccharofermentans sp.]|nr:preprotein translocase subunit YajC [Saccharofermentans sp.]
MTNELIALFADVTQTPETQQAAQAEWIMMIGMVVLFGAIFYFMVYLPQKRRDKKLKEQMDKLCIGDKVATIGGLVGVVANMTDDEVTIYTSAANTPVTFTKAAIQTVVPRNPENTDSKKDKKSSK